ncbi:MAG TPA: GAF domain-containing protein [Gammaproteobacteria bacterium]|nr:GAF domain-containing protein [Gammaproteobacteria bacterium]
MFELKSITVEDKPALYAELVRQAQGLLHGERDLIANAANFCALLYYSLPDVNWAGFYFLKDGELVVGPFQGKPACVRIALGKGVCGKVAQQRTSIVVPDVNQFPGHIFCDGASLSEVAVPLIKDHKVLGVLDVDSPRLSRFDEEDRAGLEKLAETFLGAV